MIVRYVDDTRAEQYLAKICFNTAYPPLVKGSPYSATVLKEQLTNPKLRALMLESIKKEGFRNPILGYTCDDGLLFKFGQTRLQHARDLDIPLPALIVDHLERYTDRPEVTMENYKEFFTDPPTEFNIDYEKGTAYYTYWLGPHNRYRYDAAGIEWIGDDPTGALHELPGLDRQQYLKDRLCGSPADIDKG